MIAHRGMSAFRRLLDHDGVMACVAVPGLGDIAYVLFSLPRPISTFPASMQRNLPPDAYSAGR